MNNNKKIETILGLFALGLFLWVSYLVYIARTPGERKQVPKNGSNIVNPY